MQRTNTNQVLQEISNLIESKDFKSIEEELNKFNIFKVLKNESNELRHSNILAWLLNPNESHKLDLSFLKNFLEKNQIEFKDEKSLFQTTIRREYNNIDLMLINEIDNFCIVIENKFYSKEHSNQLKRYRDIINKEFSSYNKYFLYLTLHGDEPSDDLYKSFEYSTIIDLIKKNLPYIKDSNTKFFLEHYIKILDPIVNSENHLNKLADEVFQKFKKPLEFIFEHKSDDLIYYQNKLEEFILNNNQIILDESSKTFIRFTSNNLKKILERSKESIWTSSRYNFLFEIKNFKDYFYLDIVFSPCLENEKYLDYLEKNKLEYFNLKSNKWRYSRLLSIKKSYNNYEKNLEKFLLKFQNFLGSKLEDIEKEYALICKEVKK